MPADLLTIRDLNVNYGQIEALHKVNVDVREGEAVALIGANGAGKSTLLKTIIGLLPPRSGSIIFAGAKINTVRPERRAHLRLGYCPEGREIFPAMTVRENLEVASWRPAHERKRLLGEVYQTFPALAEKETSPGWQLSGGQQQMLAIGRALMGEPRLLLLDEPSLGLSPILVHQVFKNVESIVERGTAVLLAEQNASKALQICHRAYVLKVGAMVLSGQAADLRENQEVKEAYLGG